MQLINVDGKLMSADEFQSASGLTVGGGLDLEGCTGITALPEGLTVGGEIYRD